MSENTKIEWADHTFNPWEGCTKVSEGCSNCYAETRNRRWNRGDAINWGPGAPRRRTSEANWKKPIYWNRQAEFFVECANPDCRHRWSFGSWNNAESFCPVCGGPEGFAARPRVFCASLADWLDDAVHTSWLADLLYLISSTPSLDWLLLTKRPENWALRLQMIQHVAAVRNEVGISPGLEAFVSGWLQGAAPENVWLGTSAENQVRWDQRVSILIDLPAARRFVSAEPLLGPIYFRGLMPDWVIAGGESGPGARSVDPEWVRLLRDQCSEQSSFFFKQWGGTNKKKAGRILDGRTWDQVPEGILVQGEQ